MPPSHPSTGYFFHGWEEAMGLARTVGMGLIAPRMCQMRSSTREEEKKMGHWATTIPCSCSIRPHCSLCNTLLLPAEPKAGPAEARLSPPRQGTCLFASTGSGMWWGRSAGMCKHRCAGEKPAACNTGSYTGWKPPCCFSTALFEMLEHGDKRYHFCNQKHRTKNLFEGPSCSFFRSLSMKNPGLPHALLCLC